MNFFKTLMGKLFGARKGEAAYRTSIDAGKAVAPIAQPIVESLLAAHGLPTTGPAALQLLTQAAKTTVPIGLNTEVDALAGYVAAHFAPAPTK